MSAEFITKTDLKIIRGWTDAAIKKFLGDEDKNARNLKYRNASPVCLYLIDRVKQAESSEEFQQWRQRSEKRRESARKAAAIRKQRQEEREQAAIEEENKKRELLEYQYQRLKNSLNEVLLPFQPLSYKELVALTCNTWLKENPNIEPLNSRIEVETISFPVLIRPFGVHQAKQFLALTERICDALDKYNIAEPVDNYYEQITHYQQLCKECYKVITDCKAHGSKNEYKALKKSFNLHNLSEVMGTRDVKGMSTHLYNFVDLVGNGREIVHLQGSQSCVNLQQLIKKQIISIHSADLEEIQVKLNTIITSEDYRELAAEYDITKWAHRRYEELLTNAYPRFFKR
ncbi:MAG: hypothetical protein SAK29_35810 [Scytonema sp. PMC 1069.18]|nr:hypothetical protein [Scytonema sp. PMC 1069.18]MEC4886174.1 hypothetical protein [Scytonema sp. PMC 1070.18]